MELAEGLKLLEFALPMNDQLRPLNCFQIFAHSSTDTSTRVLS
jgi:hypothetical protein